MDYMRPYINFAVTNELISDSYNFVHTDYEWLDQIVSHGLHVTLHNFTVTNTMNNFAFPSLTSLLLNTALQINTLGSG